MVSDFQYAQGDQLDGFEVVAPLYAGALAQVYRGIDILTRQTVVIKVPSMDIVNNPLVYYHFQNEVRVLAGISHPRIIRLIQQDRSIAYSIFEYITGSDLRKRLDAAGTFSLFKAKHYAAQIAQGLEHLHNCGILHLDIKPENVIVTPLDTVKIIDFGLARRLGDRDVLHEDFTIPHGTPYYAAPEQLERYRDEPRSDLYCLAMVFYEMLTGRLPFEKTSDINRVRRRLKTDPIPPRQYRSDIPVEMERIMLKALHRDPERRYASVRAFIDALQGKGASEIGLRASSLYTDRLPDACTLRGTSIQSGDKPQGILAALQDNGQAERVVAVALQEAIVRGTTVTLLTVVDGDREDEWTRYADEVSGKQWGRRIETFAQRFRHYGIDPVVRIRTGDPATVILDTANTLKADLIIMGPSNRKLFKRLLGGRTIARVLKRAPCRVQVAQKVSAPRFPYDAGAAVLTEDELRQIDYFLVALWIQHLNWLAALMQGLLGEPEISMDFSISKNPLNNWLARIKKIEQWRVPAKSLEAPQSSLDNIVTRMVSAVRQGDDAGLRSLYLERALPLLCRLRDGLQGFSTALREQSAIVQYRRVHILDQSICPLDHGLEISGGPIRQIQAIREHFCSHPDASPGQCLEGQGRESDAFAAKGAGS